MNAGQTTAAVQGYLDQLADLDGDAGADPIVAELIGRSVRRLHQLCSTLLYRSYPRLTRPPLSMVSEELLSSVVERLLKAMRRTRPDSVRGFFALANQHLRWELNDLARRLDEEQVPAELHDSDMLAPQMSDSGLSVSARRILTAIDSLPADEREVLELVRIQGLSHTEVAEMLDVSVKTVQRRLNRAVLLLSSDLGDLR